MGSPGRRAANLVAGVAIIATSIVYALAYPYFILALVGSAIAVYLIFRCSAAAVCLIAALTPIDALNNFDFIQVKAAKLALVGIAACALIAPRIGQLFRDTPIGDPYGRAFRLLLISAFFATLMARLPATSVLGLISLSVPILYYYSIRNSTLGADDVTKLLCTVMFVAAASATLCLVQLTQGYGVLLGSRYLQNMESEGAFATVWPTIQRASALSNGPSAAAGFLSLGLIAAFAHSIAFRKARYCYVAIGLLCLAGLLTTFSRGGIFGGIVGLAFACHYLGKLSWRRVGIIGVIVCGISVWAIGIDNIRAYLRLGSDLADASPSRVDAWKASKLILGNNPILGIGFYQFEELSRGVVGFETPKQPHNGLLKTLVEQGPIGACGYVLLIITFLRRSRHIPIGASAHTKWILGSIAGAGVALFSQELFDATLTVGGSSIAILFACMLAFQSIIQDREHRTVLPSGTT